MTALINSFYGHQFAGDGMMKVVFKLPHIIQEAMATHIEVSRFSLKIHEDLNILVRVDTL